MSNVFKGKSQNQQLSPFSLHPFQWPTKPFKQKNKMNTATIFVGQSSLGLIPNHFKNFAQGLWSVVLSKAFSAKTNRLSQFETIKMFAGILLLQKF